MPTTHVRETTVYTLAELEALGWSVHEKAIQQLIEWSWEGWEPSFYSDDVAYFVKYEYKLFDMQRTSLEWSTNPNWIKAKGDIDLVDYMKDQKLCNKLRSLYYALTVHGLETCIGVSFGMGEDVDLNDVERGIDYDIDGLKYDSPRYLKLMDQLKELAKDIDNYMGAIEDRLLSNLRKEIDWQCSEEKAKEDAESHELVFTEDGDIYHG